MKRLRGIGTALLSLGVISVFHAADVYSRLYNLSLLGSVDGESPVPMTLGFTAASQDTQPFGLGLLLRAVGPSLAQFGIENFLPSPILNIWSNGAVLETVMGYGADEMVGAVDTGAFPLLPGAMDAGELRTFAPGGYSLQITSSSSASGTVLAELYEEAGANNNLTPTGNRLVNLSGLTYVAARGQAVVGFVLGGSTQRALLIRAAGPALAQPPFALPQTMPDPQFVIAGGPQGGDAVVATNSGWGGKVQVAATAASVGAFAFASPSADAGIVVKLQPGTYTIAVSSQSESPGVVLAEIYLVPLP